MKHSELVGADNHVIYTFIYSDSNSRTSATGFISTDKGKVAWQQDDDTFWILTNHSPVTWKTFGSGSGSSAPVTPEDTRNITSAVSIQLLLTDKLIQNVNMTTENKMVELPDSVLGQALGLRYIISNSGYYTFILQSSNSGVYYIKPGTIYKVYLMDNTTAEGVWNISIHDSNTMIPFTQGLNTTFSSKTGNEFIKVVRLANDLAAVCYHDTSKWYVNLLKVDGSTISKTAELSGTSVTGVSAGLTTNDSSKMFIGYNVTATAVYYSPITYTPTSLTLGAQIISDTSYATENDALQLSDTRHLSIVTRFGNGNGGHLILVDSATLLSKHDIIVTPTNDTRMKVIRLSSTRVIVSYMDTANNLWFKVVDVVNDILIVTYTTSLAGYADSPNTAMSALTDSKFVFMRRPSGSDNNELKVVTVNLDGTLVFNSSVTVTSNNLMSTGSVAMTSLGLNKALIAYNNVTSSKGEYRIAHIDGVSITLDPVVVFHPEPVSYVSVAALTETSAMLAFRDSNLSNFGVCCLLTV